MGSMVLVPAGFTLTLEVPDDLPLIQGAELGLDPAMAADEFVGDLGVWDPAMAGVDDAAVQAWTDYLNTNLGTPADFQDPGSITPDMGPDANPGFATDVSQMSAGEQKIFGDILSQNDGQVSPLQAAEAAKAYTAANNAFQAQAPALGKQGYIGMTDQQGNVTMGQVVGPTGQPIDVTSLTPQQLQQLQQNVNVPGSGVTFREANPTTDAGFFSTMKDVMGPLSSFLQTPAGKLIGAMGVGGLTTGLSAAITGNTARVPNAIRTTPNAATIQSLLGAGQNAALAGLEQGGAAGLARTASSGLQGAGTLADILKLQTEQQLGVQRQQQPIEQGVAMQALGQLPGQMNATTNPNIMGTGTLGQTATRGAQSLVPQQTEIGQGIGQQIQNVLSGNYSNPILENQIKLQKDAFRAKMYAQLGPGWETSTPGMQAQEQQDLLEHSVRFQDQQQTLGNYTNLYNQTVGQQVQTGSQATGQVQQAQAQGVGQNVGLSQLGKQDPSKLTANLNTLAPPTTYAGLQSAAQSQAQLISNQQQANLANTQSENAANQSLAQGIGQVGGIAAAGLFGPQKTLSGY
jgi:hypothetical protein